MRWLIVLPWQRPGHMGVDFEEELTALGHEARTFASRRDNQHHPMNDIVGVNARTFELAAAAACQVVDFKEDLATLFKPGEELVTYSDLADLKRQLDHHLAHPDEAAAVGANARRRALAEHTLRRRIEEIVATVEERLGR